MIEIWEIKMNGEILSNRLCDKLYGTDRFQFGDTWVTIFHVFVTFFIEFMKKW